MATELIKGRTVKEALALTNSAVVEALDGLPPVKIHCSVLAEEAVKTAIADYYKKIGREVDFSLESADERYEH
jgi:nitrogen fixation NifU-like protein